MDWTQVLSIIVTILISAGTGFGWLISRMDKKFDHLEQRINQIETRLTVIETILAMMGAPVKGFKNPHTDP